MENAEEKENTQSKPPILEVEVEGGSEVESKKEPMEEVQTQTIITEAKKPKNIKKCLIVILIMLVVALIAGGIFISTRTNKSKQIQKEVQSTPAPVVELTPTPVVLNKAGLKINIQNGSGVTGKAKQAQTMLEKAGYTNIQTGNAKTFNYPQTEISIKESKGNYLEELRKDLLTAYTIASQAGVLEEANTFDVVIILGKK